jgi:nucleotidyltransferase-like protein
MHPHERTPRVSTLWPPTEVRTVCETYLSMVDEELPGLVEGLYLHGSIGFGEWHPGRSDVDFVAVTRERPTPREVARLDAVHERLGSTFPSPSYDGFYATWADLAGPTDDCPDVPCILAGEFQEAGRFDVNPVTWHELAWHGLTLRGPDLADVDVRTDLPTLRRFTHDNLSSYWEPHVRELARFPGEAGRPDLVAWFALGIPRLHHVLATDRLTSKDGAGEYALEVFGEEWRILLAEALSYRVTGERIGMLDEAELSRQNIAFAELAVAAALALRP